VEGPYEKVYASNAISPDDTTIKDAMACIFQVLGIDHINSIINKLSSGT
jgi:hypothetical protein